MRTITVKHVRILADIKVQASTDDEAKQRVLDYVAPHALDYFTIHESETIVIEGEAPP